MKIKKASIFSLVVALALVVGVTTAFATSAANAAEQDSLALGAVDFELNDYKSGVKAVNLADGDNTDGLVQVIGSQTYDEHEAININDLNSIDATNILKDAQPGLFTLRSVSHDDERKFTPEEWAKILDLIDEGKVFWED